jgi:hypothetical protein
MSRVNLIWTMVIVVINIVLVGYLRHYVVSDSSDKSVILFWFYYPVIIISNSIAWVTIRKTELRRPMQIIIITLLVLFFPLLFTLW